MFYLMLVLGFVMMCYIWGDVYKSYKEHKKILEEEKDYLDK